MNRVEQRPNLPVYDSKKDGNPFEWIYETAKKVRSEREPICRLGVPNKKLK